MDWKMELSGQGTSGATVGSDRQMTWRRLDFFFRDCTFDVIEFVKVVKVYLFMFYICDIY